MPNAAAVPPRRARGTITGLSRISRKPPARGKRRDLMSKSARVAGEIAKRDGRKLAFASQNADQSSKIKHAHIIDFC
jgi:hypothetical protein